MKKLISILMLVFSSFIFANSNSSSTSSLKTLKVTGTANISAPVDTIILNIFNKDTKPTYAKSLEASKYALVQFKQELLLKGFQEKDLKTINFNITTNYENYKDEKGNSKKRFLGYQYSHNMKISFKLDNSKLSEVLNSLKTIKGKSEFYLNYTIKDTEKIKNKLLSKAVENTKTKANILASASNVNLKNIINIDYSFNHKNNFISPFRGEMKMLGSNISSDSIMNITPEDLKFQDTVTITWEIN